MPEHLNLVWARTASPFRWLRVASQFALLGAVIAGMFTAVPLPVVAAADAAVDFRAVGALLGLVAGIAQLARSATEQ